VGVALLAAACARSPEPITTELVERFDAPSLGAAWHATAGAYRVEQGALVVERAYNHPLWLLRPLPEAAVIEFTAWTDDPRGDVKVELYGDGRSHAEDRGAYVASGYVAIFGGWRNTVSVLARLDEHGGDRKERPAPRVEPGRRYRFKLERTGAVVRWFLDGVPFLAYSDDLPLVGPSHRHFAINGWETQVWFDDLRIAPLPAPAPAAPP
jgi:hypothetical protein